MGVSAPALPGPSRAGTTPVSRAWWRSPVLLLLLLTPGIPEYLTGSSSATLLFLNPLAFALFFALNAGLYTTGALLIREAVVRWGKGWGSVLLLGAAYGIVEEGLAVHTFFQTSGTTVGALGTYGHLWGVNWVWALGLSVFHAVYSIALPILLLGIVYPETRGRSLIAGRGIATTMGLYLADVLLLTLIAPNHPNAAQTAFFVAVVGLLVYLAFRIPSSLLKAKAGRSTATPRRFALLGCGLFFLWLIVSALLPRTGVPPVVDVAVFVGVLLAILYDVLRSVGTVDAERAQLAFAAGLLIPLIPWELLLVGASNPIALVLGILTLFALYRLRRRVWARTELPPPPSATLESLPRGAVAHA